MKQVSLIIPKDQNPEKPGIFIGVLYLASYLKQKGIPVKIYDEQFGDATNNLQEIIDNSLLVGFSVMTSQLKSAKELSKKIHENNIPIVWGGIHPMLFPDQCLKEDYVDILTYDEAEETLYKLAKNIEHPEKVIGIYYKKIITIQGIKTPLPMAMKITKNRPRPYLDLNEIEPDWSLLDTERYVYEHILDGEKKEIFPVHIGRGCVWKCSFCIHHCLNERKHRGVSAENIVREVKRILKFKDVKNFIFVDDMFFMDFNRVKEFCGLYKKEGFTFGWIATARVDNVKVMDDNLLTLLKEAGCKYLSMGVESGSQRVLDELIHKGTKVEDVLPAVEKLKKHGITPGCSFMSGIPGETEEEQDMTFDLIKKILKVHDKAHVMGPQLYRPYPGAEMYQMAKDKGFQEPQSIDDWIEFLNNFGFLDINQLTWIPNRQKLINKIKYCVWSQIKPKGFAKPLGLLFRGIFRLRMKLDFYHFGFDIFLYEKMKQFYIEKVGG